MVTILWSRINLVCQNMIVQLPVKIGKGCAITYSHAKREGNQATEYKTEAYSKFAFWQFHMAKKKKKLILPTFQLDALHCSSPFLLMILFYHTCMQQDQVKLSERAP